MAKEVTEEDTYAQVVARLETKFPEIAKEDIENATRTELTALSGRPVKDYLAILVERAAKKKLKKLDLARSPR